MPTPAPTPSEIVETLKRSSLPTIITEGLEDYLVFRRLEKRFADLGVSLLPAGGKPALLEIYNRRAEFAHIRFACIADRDMWIFTGVPVEYQADNLVLTDGYSIENDLYRDSSLENLLSDGERQSFLRERDAICRWFSFAVAKRCAGRDAVLKFHPSQILQGANLHADFVALVGFDDHCPYWYPVIVEQYTRYLRGKTLMHLIVRHLSYAGRAARHNYRALMEMAGNVPGDFLNAMSARLDAVFR